MTSYFAEFVNFVGAHPHYALTAVFLLALSEAIPVIGTVVPGSTLIVGISALATAVDVNPWLLLVAAQCSREHRYARDVATRPIETVDDTRLYRIAAIDEHYRDCRGRAFRR